MTSSGQRKLPEEIWLLRDRGCAVRSKALSGAADSNLVALETWKRGNEIANLKQRRNAHGGSAAVGRIDCWPVPAGSGRTGQKTGIASGRVGGGGRPGDGGRRRSSGGRGGSGRGKDRIHRRSEGSWRQ